MIKSTSPDKTTESSVIVKSTPNADSFSSTSSLILFASTELLSVARDIWFSSTKSDSPICDNCSLLIAAMLILPSGACRFPVLTTEPPTRLIVSPLLVISSPLISVPEPMVMSPALIIAPRGSGELLKLLAVLAVKEAAKLTLDSEPKTIPTGLIKNKLELPVTVISPSIKDASSPITLASMFSMPS